MCWLRSGLGIFEQINQYTAYVKWTALEIMKLTSDLREKNVNLEKSEMNA